MPRCTEAFLISRGETKMEKNRILELSGKPVPELMKTFLEMTQNVEKTERETLQDILAQAAETEIGKKYEFGTIDSYETFIRKIPITEYKEYQPYIEKLGKGAEDILYPGKTAMFLATSGSTGVPKYIPESTLGDKVKKMVVALRYGRKYQLLAEELKGLPKIITMSNPSQYGKTEGGIQIGSASGQATEGISASEQQMLTLPKEVLALSDVSTADRDYLILLFAVAEKNAKGVICNNPGHFSLLMKRVNQELERITTDLETGTISVEMDRMIKESLDEQLGCKKERAEELRTKKKEKGILGVADIWPEFMFVNCWMAGSVGRVLKDVQSELPKQVKYLDAGYGASEGKFTIPMQVNSAIGVLFTPGFFFEFLPLEGGEPLPLWKVKKGKSYVLIITSYSGFYRYNMHDIVRIGEDFMGTPQIVFESKQSDCMKWNGKILYSGQLTDVVETFETTYNCRIRHFEMYQDERDEISFVFENGHIPADPETFARYMKKKLQEKYGIRIKKILEMKEGYRNSLFTRTLKPGKSVNQTKLAVFTAKAPDMELCIREWQV